MKTLFLFLFITLSNYNYYQTPNENILSNIVDDKELKNYSYILLVEQTHGDGAVFDEKVKIIKQLHTESGFKTILFEAGFYDNFKAWELYKQNNDIEIYNESIFSIWSETEAFQELL